MNPVDIQIVVRKTKLILDDLTRLEEYRSLTKDEYLSSFETQMVVERLLERILTRIIDINYHILGQKHDKTPLDYTDSFVQMMREGEISNEIFEEIKPAAGLRNVLAHEYDEIDPEKVYEGMQNALKLIRVYLKSLQLI